MHISVIIPTLNRAGLLPQILNHLDQQKRPPNEVILSAPDESHVCAYSPKTYKLSCVFGPKGLCLQRNRAMANVLAHADIITFFDDDFLPASDYLQTLEAAFLAHPEWAVIAGHVSADGARGPGFSLEDGLEMLRKAERGRTPEYMSKILKHPGAYGCNMSMRAKHIGNARFDERLVLYGWQEDIDFTNRLKAYGDIVELWALQGLHLGVKSGRVSGVKLGYSQICNPVYLVKKGTMPPRFAFRLMYRNIIANTVKSFRPEPYVDRRGRLKGNLLAAFHIMTGKVEPEYVLKL